MSWFVLRREKQIVYLSDEQYDKYFKLFTEQHKWSVSDKLDSYISGTVRNKEKQKLYDYIIGCMRKEWKEDREAFRKKYSFAFHADDILKNLYELVWGFCEINQNFHMMKKINGIAIKPKNVDINLQVTFGNDFFICESRGLIHEKIVKEVRIETDNIVYIYGDMMQFRIRFENGIELIFQTDFDGRKARGSIIGGFMGFYFRK